MSCAICGLDHIGNCVPALKRELERLRLELHAVRVELDGAKTELRVSQKALGAAVADVNEPPKRTPADRRNYMRQYMRDRRAKGSQ